MIEPGLHDGHLDGLEVVEVTEKTGSPQTVKPQLRVARSFDFDALAVFEVKYFYRVAADQDRVGRPEALRDPFVQAETLLHQDLRIGPRGHGRLVDQVVVALRALVHFRGVHGVLLDAGDLLQIGLGIEPLISQPHLHFELGQGVGQSPFAGVFARLLCRALVLQGDGARAVHPSISLGGAALSMVFRHRAFPPLWPGAPAGPWPRPQSASRLRTP